MESLRIAKLKYIHEVLKANGWDRKVAAEILKVSTRGLYNYILQYNKEFPDNKIKDNKIKKPGHKTKLPIRGVRIQNGLCPTNEERLAHLDNMINRDHL